MDKKHLDFYRQILVAANINERLIDGYLEYCLNDVKEQILQCHNTTVPTNKILVELFKRAISKKHNNDKLFLNALSYVQ